MSTVRHIFVCPIAGLPMMPLITARALAGLGLEGDRYAIGKGTFSGTRHNLRHVSLIGVNDFNAANSTLDVPFTLAETRRNLVIEGAVDLLNLIAREFWIGEVHMRGVEECTPCKRPAQLAQKADFF